MSFLLWTQRPLSRTSLLLLCLGLPFLREIDAKAQLSEGISNEAGTIALCQQLNDTLDNLLGYNACLLADLRRHLQLEQQHTRQLLDLELELADPRWSVDHGRQEHIVSQIQSIHEESQRHMLGRVAILSRLRQLLAERARATMTSDADGAGDAAIVFSHTMTADFLSAVEANLRFLPQCMLARPDTSQYPGLEMEDLCADGSGHPNGQQATNRGQANNGPSRGLYQPQPHVVMEDTVQHQQYEDVDTGRTPESAQHPQKHHHMRRQLLRQLDQQQQGPRLQVPDAGSTTAAITCSRRPLVSLLVQYYNRPWMLPGLAEAFHRCAPPSRNMHPVPPPPPRTASTSPNPHDSHGAAGDGGGGQDGVDPPREANAMLESGLGFRGVSELEVEMLVNVDSRDDAAAVAAFAAAHDDGFVTLVYGNNVHEIRSYNRLAYLARGKILVLLQDDDVFAEGTACTWLTSVVRAFRRWPRMGAIGSQRFVFDYHPNSTQEGVHFWDPGAGPVAGLGRSRGVAAAGSKGEGEEGDESSHVVNGRLEMQFVSIVDYAPIAVRRSAFLGLGGIDENMSEAGMCGVHSDYDLSMRMWLAGWQVGYVQVPGGLGKDPREQEGGTHRQGVSGYCWQRQWELAIGYMRGRWGQHCRWEPDSYYWFGSNAFEVIAEHVRLLNLRLLRPLAQPPGSYCPFGYGCDEVPRDRITRVPTPVSPLFGNLSSWPKHNRAAWGQAKAGAVARRSRGFGSGGGAGMQEGIRGGMP